MILIYVKAYIKDAESILRHGEEIAMPLFGAFVLFGIFTANVVLGAAGGSQFMGDVSEMLVLMATAVMFVIAILKSEAAAQDNASSATKSKGRTS